MLLADGSRALAQAGRWAQALQHLQDHNGVGQRLLDGRQIAIIAHHVAGDHRLAAHLLAETSMQTPWEQVVATCLAVLTSDRSTDTKAMTDSVLALDDAPGQVFFRTRLRLTAIDLTDAISPLAHAIESDVLRSGDAYAAREVSTPATCASQLSARAISTFTRLVDTSGLGKESVPADLLNQLTTAVTAAEASLTRALTQHDALAEETVAPRDHGEHRRARPHPGGTGEAAADEPADIAGPAGGASVSATARSAG
ncbi:hypothetical protein AB0O34_13485 [Sphaerisporangium sp. NPDC088356]|uniref:hypothetical protein n=1 Tax=Sphaerisporangium sp. NPDC088356 TaxID=3154871 RepID=UPI003430FF72